MTLSRSYFFAATCGLSLAVIGCGSDEKTNPGVDASTPAGTHYGYVVSKASVPTTDAQILEYGLDLGSSTSSTPDGQPDNELGGSLKFLGGPPVNFAVQDTITESVDQGGILLLLDVQTDNFTTARAAGFGVKLGADPMPAACSNDTDTTCRHHLDGSGMFSIAQTSPENSSVSGAFSGGTFTGGPGSLSLQIALGSPTPITLNLVNARVKATAVTEAGLTAVIGGLLLVDEVDRAVVPAVHAQIGPTLERDCGPEANRQLPDCGCVGTGATIMGLFDIGANKDCRVTLEDVQSNPFTKELLEPDTCSKSTCPSNQPDALSIGIKVEAVKAKFPGIN